MSKYARMEYFCRRYQYCLRGFDLYGSRWTESRFSHLSLSLDLPFFTKIRTFHIPLRESSDGNREMTPFSYLKPQSLHKKVCGRNSNRNIDTLTVPGKCQKMDNWDIIPDTYESCRETPVTTLQFFEGTPVCRSSSSRSWVRVRKAEVSLTKINNKFAPFLY